TVAQMTEMRVKARETGVYLRVVRNTLAKRAMQGTEYECLDGAFVGPTLVAFSQEEPGSAARLLKDYAKQHDALEVRALAIGGELLSADQLDRVALLPTLDQARAMVLAVLQAPVIKLARTLNEVPGKLTRTVAAIRDQKQAEA
ncbi:MAG: large subunit ribosomal protein L10, partial [Limisphaerales bacterium]